MKKTLSLVLTMCMMLSLFATFVISASADEAVNLAAGKEVANQENIDSSKTTMWIDTDLTDGVVETGDFTSTIKWAPGQWFGYYSWKDAPETNSVDGVAIPTVDLGAVCNIESARVHVYGGPGWSGIVPPTKVELLVSNDGENWTSAGAIDVTKEETNCSVWLEVKAPAGTTGKYARIAMTHSEEGSWLFIDELEVYGTEAKAEAPVLEWKPMFISHFNNNTVEGSGVIMTEAYDGAVWWIHVALAPVAGLDGVYEVVAISDGVPEGKGVAQAIPEGGFVYALNTGNDYPALGLGDTDFTSPNCSNMIADVQTWKVGDKFVFDGLDLEGKTIPTTTADLNWYDDAYVCTAKYAAYVPGASSAVKEEITVDGDLTDTGWNNKGWNVVTGENGFWQNTYEISLGEQVAPDFGYKYQFRTDDTKLYGAIVVDGAAVAGGNGVGTFPRLWIRDNDEATIYTHFYNIEFTEDGSLKLGAKYNTSLTENVSADIEDTTFVAASKEVDGKCVFEFSIDISEFCADGTFDYFVSVHQVAGDVKGCLFHPASEVGPTDPNGGENHVPHKWLPFRVWHTEKDATINVKDIVLGEVVVSDEEEADTSMMGTAPATPAFTVTLNTAEGWVAGEKLVVTATVDILEDIDLSQIMFNLYYDAADVEIVLPEDLGAIITTGKDSWKEDSLFTLTTSGDYGVIECAPATTVEADVLKKGEQLVMTFEFTVKAEAEGLINFQLSNKGLVGYSWDLTAAEAAGAGSNLAVENADNYGDTGIYVIAALALVALLGTAIVIKKRA